MPTSKFRNVRIVCNFLPVEMKSVLCSVHKEIVLQGLFFFNLRIEWEKENDMAEQASRKKRRVLLWSFSKRERERVSSSSHPASQFFFISFQSQEPSRVNRRNNALQKKRKKTEIKYEAVVHGCFKPRATLNSYKSGTIHLFLLL